MSARGVCSDRIRYVRSAGRDEELALRLAEAWCSTSAAYHHGPDVNELRVRDRPVDPAAPAHVSLARGERVDPVGALPVDGGDTGPARLARSGHRPPRRPLPGAAS